MPWVGIATVGAGRAIRGSLGSRKRSGKNSGPQQTAVHLESFTYRFKAFGPTSAP